MASPHISIATDCRQTLPKCVSRINEQLLKTARAKGRTIIFFGGGDEIFSSANFFYSAIFSGAKNIQAYAIFQKKINSAIANFFGHIRS